MDLVIEDAETLQMIEKLVALTGDDAETAVLVALREKLARIRDGEPETKLQA